MKQGRQPCGHTPLLTHFSPHGESDQRGHRSSMRRTTEARLAIQMPERHAEPSAHLIEIHSHAGNASRKYVLHAEPITGLWNVKGRVALLRAPALLAEIAVHAAPVRVVDPLP